MDIPDSSGYIHRLTKQSIKQKLNDYLFVPHAVVAEQRTAIIV